MPRLRIVRSTLREPVLRAAEWALARAGLYRAEVKSDTGFFAQLSGLMTVLRVCERRGLTPAVTLSSALYTDPQRPRDFLGYFFDGPALTPAQRRLAAALPVRRERDFSLLPGWSRYDYPPIDDSPRLFGKYYRLKADVAEEVRSFAAAHFAPGRTLGVHFRGTDKLRTDSTAIDYDGVTHWIRRCLTAYPDLTHLFVASDEQGFLPAVLREFPTLTVSAYADHVLSDAGAEAIHLSPAGSAYHKGRDALLNALLLAECDVLLKTMSNLSGWARVFRPSRPTFLLNRPDKAGVDTLGFPEREMVERGWFADSLLVGQ